MFVSRQYEEYVSISKTTASAKIEMLVLALQLFPVAVMSFSKVY